MIQRPGLSTRRGLVSSAVATVLLLGATGCSVLDKAQAAAIIDGKQVTTAQVAETTRQINEFVIAPQPNPVPLTEARTLSLLILSDFAVDYFTKSGAWKPNSDYTTLLARIPDASPETVDLVKLAVILNSPGIDATSQKAITTLMQKADIQVDPRYGAWDTSTFEFDDRGTNWIKQVAEPDAPAPTTGQ